MKYNLEKYGQYKNDIFNKLGFSFEKGKNILDVGCGDCSDAKIFHEYFKLDVYGIDIYEHGNLKESPFLKFKKAGIYEIPYPDSYFDYVFLHDILHHIDEDNQSFEKHIAGIKELKRVVKEGGQIIIVEGNRYNPLFYPHMVKMLRHNHWRQRYFKKVISQVFRNSDFKFFESHLYPKNWLWFWKIYEFIMEKFSPNNFLAYNVAIIKK